MNQFAAQGTDITLSGPLTIHSLPVIWNNITKHVKTLNRTASLQVDLNNVDTIDSAGVAFLGELSSHFARPVDYINIPKNVQTAIDSFSSPQVTTPKKSSLINPFEWLADIALVWKSHFMFFLYLTADVFYWSVVGLVKKKGQRKGSFAQQSILIGVDALPIVGLISFLIGLILALQSAAQLRQFGANIFVADLIGIAMLREMGPIMTAIVVAGRSGSAIASEIATMVVTEEIDALKTMALNPVRYVIVPKFHGISLTMPLLTIFSDFLGILGGFVIGITYLQLSAQAFINELFTVLILKDILTGLFKSVVFAWLIVIIGCYNGLRVHGGAEGVGRATTASVVMSIFFVIVADSIMGLLFYFE
ncbi:MlaE family lipid ABC transporter permease subunit [candidate division KSB1 bacterium]|nr:MlaE family lipid ABC transporter permease subunit [candidate division KSB1 bacterium]